ncbi:hypothetical protein M9Y10_035144 [Tritrichomonas musculus]|uniref:Uncharacterized protein n=1 Tax=Tritrichomonas musculus TaxID=1915356 RepID=A0ABR2KGV2_9EUKA
MSTRSGSQVRKTNRPSLVVLADGKQTNFQRRLFNPDEFNPNRYLPSNNVEISDRNKSNYDNSSGDDDGDDDGDDGYDGNGNNNNSGDDFSDDDNIDGVNGDDLGVNGDDLGVNGDDLDLDWIKSRKYNQFEEDDFDARSSASTSAFSTALPPDEIFSKLQQQLDFSFFGDLFSGEFDRMNESEQRQLGRFGRLQIVKKKNWIKQLWNLFDPRFYSDEDGDDDGTGSDKNKSNLSSKLLALFQLFNQMDENPDDLSPEFTQDPYAICLNKAAKKTLNEFIFSDKGGLNLFMRAAIMGPSGSGKSVYLRFIFMRILNFLIDGGRFKEFLIVPFDFKHSKITSIESFYRYFSGKAIEALIIQRPDLQLFENSLRKAFAILPTTTKIKHLPKPLSSQDYLRHPLKQLEQVLIRMHYCYNEPKLVDSFLTNVVLLPQTLASIFSFRSAFLVIDHLDALDIEIKQKGKPAIQLLEFVKFGLTTSQYLISCIDGETFSEKLNAMDQDSVDIRNQTQNIYVYDTVFSKFKGESILVTFEKTAPQKTMTLSDSHCGGCISFISKYDQVCERIVEMNNASSRAEKKEVKVKLMKEIVQYIEDMYNFDSLPKIERVELIQDKDSDDHDSNY